MEKISQEKVRHLFNERAKLYGQIPTLNIALFQEKHGDLAQKRNQIERDAVMAIIGDQITKNWLVLDAGCGTGRWAHFLASMVKGVVAFDISDGLLQICRSEGEKLGINNVIYHQATLGDFVSQMPHPNIIADLVILSGVCLFTNDEEWSNIISNVQTVTRPNSLIVIREPCGSHGRYELRDIWSEDLQTEYSATYRGPDWFRGAFGTFCEVVCDMPLFPPNLEKWEETHQHLFVFKVVR